MAKKSVTVRDVNKNKCVAWARERKNWTVEQEWKKWIFSDESQIVIGANNKILIWRKDHEINEPHLVCPRKRGQVSFMVWGCICYEGVGTLTGVEGNINAAKYRIAGNFCGVFISAILRFLSVTAELKTAEYLSFTILSLVIHT